jgi:hypothetical protein
MFEHYTPSCLHNPTACESKGRGAKQMKGWNKNATFGKRTIFLG